MAFTLYILLLQDKLVFMTKGDIKCLRLFCISVFILIGYAAIRAETVLNSSFQVYKSSVSLLAR